MIEVRPAAAEQAIVAVDILLEAVAWLNAKGEPLWKAEELRLETFEATALRGELFLAYQEGEAVGTITFQLQDKPYWPQFGYGESAFFHKLAIRRKAAGQGLAKAMVEWAIQRTQSLGISHLRMDTAFDRPKLRAFYEDLGFEYVVEKTVGFHHLALYELPLRKRDEA